MPKARTIDQLLTTFQKEVPDLQPAHYAAVKDYLIKARNEVTLEKAERAIKQNEVISNYDSA